MQGLWSLKKTLHRSPVQRFPCSELLIRLKELQFLTLDFNISTPDPTHTPAKRQNSVFKYSDSESTPKLFLHLTILPSYLLKSNIFLQCTYKQMTVWTVCLGERNKAKVFARFKVQAFVIYIFFSCFCSVFLQFPL